ncbi:glycoside hydrolase family 2 protein [Streptomyces caniscabiei]|uniref:glycoside hydrolase family 2 protein n=1 Tax=Streptomyces caniscabiei TaxID=2746961 RepID=UPI000765F068|nr:glycoside hydrolase family 2 TIM barrel-domain containing protein [Streptomyces caniscabiei]
MTGTDVQLDADRVDLRDWTVRRPGSAEEAAVRLPHDAMITEPRSSDASGRSDTGWFPGGRYTYRTRWYADPAYRGRDVQLRFDGIQGESVVTVNGHPVGAVRSGYTEFGFRIDDLLNWGDENEIAVDVDNSAQPAGRWYPGSGLYRSVALRIRSRVRLEDDGVGVRTTLHGADAVVEVRTAVVNDSDRPVHVRTVLHSEAGAVAQAVAADDGIAHLHVPGARLWSAEDPFRYELVTTVEHDGAVVDTRRELVGLRTVHVDARHGLRINKKQVNLRGACIHHDNGILGAATHRAAEFRRIRILKENGFNAVRSAHHPMSRHLLDACDELGMYVMDELADYWIQSKSTHDFAHRFLDTWREDADRMIEKDRNRPSVVIYSIGNEIPETAHPDGVALTREITAYVKAADPDRPVTVALNIFLNVLSSMNRSPYADTSDTPEGAHPNKQGPGSTEANRLVNQIGRMMNVASRLPIADRATRDAFAEVDVAGYNYGLARYKRDVKAHPDRVIVGSETLPGDIARAWDLVTQYPSVIGDFIWVGWEYLGESGVGVWAPGRRTGLVKPYPYLIAGPGVIDLTGQPDFSLRLGQVAWGTHPGPAIGVRPLDQAGQPVARVAWRSTDAVESWAWRGCAGRKAEIEVYSADDEVELFVNGRPAGRRRAGRRRRYTARFTTTYAAGELVAVGYRGGHEVSRTVLRSAGDDLAIRLTADRAHLRADGDDLAFVEVEIIDGAGTVEMLADDDIELRVEGPAELVGYGSARPDPTRPFADPTQRAYRGRALAVLRSTGLTGNVHITATSHLHGVSHLTLDAR